MELEQINTIINKAWFTVRDQFIANIPAGEARDIDSKPRRRLLRSGDCLPAS